MTTLSMTIRSSDVWLNFQSTSGREASISIAALAESSGPIVRSALKAWAVDQIKGAAGIKEFPLTITLEKTHG